MRDFFPLKLIIWLVVIETVNIAGILGYADPFEYDPEGVGNTLHTPD
jgi:hypothetical protein